MFLGIVNSRTFCACIMSGVFFLCLNTAGVSGEIKKVRMIEFRNLNYLSKYEIIDKVDIKLKNNEILINTDSLDRALRSNQVISSFETSEDNGSLVITVEERTPVFLLAFRDDSRLKILELDSDLHLVSSGRVHASGMPIVIIGKEEMKGRKPSNKLRGLLFLIRDAIEERIPELAAEIDEIDLTDMSRARIYLRKRRTAFLMAPKKENFQKLNYSVGYFDRAGFYPEVFEITNDLGIIKKRKEEY